MVATSVSVTALQSLLQCHFTGCWPLLPARLELPIALETTHLPFVTSWKCKGFLHMLTGRVVELGILHARYLVIPRRPVIT